MWCGLSALAELVVDLVGTDKEIVGAVDPDGGEFVVDGFCPSAAAFLLLM